MVKPLCFMIMPYGRRATQAAAGEGDDLALLCCEVGEGTGGGGGVRGGHAAGL